MSMRTNLNLPRAGVILCLALAALLSGCTGLRPHDGVRPAETVYDEATLQASDLRIAESALQSGDLSVAMSVYRRLVQAHPGQAIVWMGLGDAHFLGGELEAARQAYLKAGELRPDMLEPQLGQARIALRQRRLEEATERFQAILMGMPDHPLALAGLGVAQDLAGRAAQAQAIYRQGLRAHPDNTALRTNLGLSLALNGQPREAINILLGATGLSGPLPQERDNLALAYGLMGREDAAEDILASYQPAGVVQDNLAFYRYLRQQLEQRSVPAAAPSQQTAPVVTPRAAVEPAVPVAAVQVLPVDAGRMPASVPAGSMPRTGWASGEHGRLVAGRPDASGAVMQ
ncbi:tetratricopeptide repeat protein [Alcaligenaceae bacterium SJ-26]|nr:tetratricopeptide repeat protein [Alcaligenaceae bacterium SJ-26]